MLQRVRQFWRALTASLSDEDRRIIRQSLSPAEQRLFAMLPVHEQVHSIRVATTAARLSHTLPKETQTLLHKAALLHDIGKAQFGLSPVAKSLAVLGAKFLPSWTRRRSINTSSLFHAYYHHPEIGRAMADELHLSPRLVALIAAHHTLFRPGEDPLLTILRKSDEAN